MPRLIKLFIAILALFVIVVLGLYITDNEHVLTAVRSTYVLGRSGPDIDNHKYFANRTVQARAPRALPFAEDYNSYTLSDADSSLLAQYLTTGFLILKDGELLYEKYWENYSDSSHSNSFSMAKSVTSLLVGCAIDDGLISSVNDKASKYLPDLKGTDREEVTIKQLLQMTSGISFDEHYGDPFGFMSQAYYGDELYERTMSYDLAHEPGTHFEYLGGNTLLLSYIVEEVTQHTLSYYATQKLWTPMHAEEDALWTYEEDSNRERAYCCFYSNVRDFSRFGQLVLNEGYWEGKQVVSSQWLEDSMVPSGVPDASGEPVDYYGYQWWLADWKGKKVYKMRGLKGQYVMVVPDDNMVVVRLGHERDEQRTDGVPNDVWKYLDLAEKITS